MTVQEFDNEFDVLYNGISSNSAPGLDQYEKSLFLTMAQEQIVKNYYNPLGNKYNEGFEKTEKRRRELSFLIKTSRSINPTNHLTDPLNTFLKIDGFNSFIFSLEQDVMFIIAEYVYGSSTNPCLDQKKIDVKPVTHDDLRHNLKNPFKRPSNRFALRLDLYKEENKPVVQILCDDSLNLTEYNYRYIRYPKPIVLDNIFVTINGVNTPQTSELPESIHREILNRAVLLALETVFNPRLKTNAQIQQLTE